MILELCFVYAIANYTINTSSFTLHVTIFIKNKVENAFSNRTQLEVGTKPYVAPSVRANKIPQVKPQVPVELKMDAAVYMNVFEKIKNV